jgi:hypothetical protein
MVPMTEPLSIDDATLRYMHLTPQATTVAVRRLDAFDEESTGPDTESGPGLTSARYRIRSR